MIADDRGQTIIQLHQSTIMNGGSPNGNQWKNSEDMDDVEKNKEKYEDAGVDSKNSERRVWLVKIPDFLADSFSDILDGMSPTGYNSEKEIGIVRLHTATAESPARVSVFLSRENSEELKECPKEYDMKFVKSQQKMHLFSEHEDEGRAIAIEGRVEQECHLKPVMNEEYRSMLQQRTIEANRPKRSIQVVDSRAERIQVGLVPHIREMDLLNRRKQRTVDVEQRRERLPENEVVNMIFQAFEGRSHWTLRALSDHLQQPTIYIRDILSKIAIYSTRGPYKNYYELRPEYK